MPEEIERLLKVADNRMRVAILLALSSLRRAEVLNLVINDIDFDKGYILVSPKKDTKETWPWEIKDHNQAITPLPEIIRLPETMINLHTELIKLIDQLPEGQPYVCLTSKQYKFMMAHKAAGTLIWEMCNSPWRGFSRDFQLLLKKASVEPRRFQDLRGTFATRMLNNGCSLVETQKLLRHSSPQTTARYYIEVEEQKLVAKSASICGKCYVT